MKKLLLGLCLGVFAVSLLANTANAHSVFMKALKAKYEFKSVSCYTCHAKGEDPKTGKRYGKEVRNDFGNLFIPHLKGKDVDARVDKAKEADDAEKAKINEGLTKDFLDALEKVEAQKTKDGKTYGEVIKAGGVEGIKLAE